MKRILFAAVMTALGLSLTIAVAADQQSQVRDSVKRPSPPPLPTCSGAGDCDSGPLICTDAAPWETLPITIAGGHAVSSDGFGAYVLGNNVKTAGAGVIGGMVFYPLTHQMKNPRSIVVDLSNPVPGGGGIARGVVTDNNDLELVAQWYTDANLARHNIHEIPVGSTVLSQQTDFGIHINGVYYWMQIGPQPIGHCHAGGTAIFGTGTSQATIYRSSTSRWEIDLPPGSIGRLFDDHNTDPYAVDKGLYYIDLHLIVGQ